MLKKEHPCGTNRWEILKTGIEIKLKCLGCEREVWIKRIDFEKRLRKVEIYKGGNYGFFRIGKKEIFSKRFFK